MLTNLSQTRMFKNLNFQIREIIHQIYPKAIKSVLQPHTIDKGGNRLDSFVYGKMELASSYRKIERVEPMPMDGEQEDNDPTNHSVSLPSSQTITIPRIA